MTVCACSLWSVFVFLIAALWSREVSAERRNLSEIRYHFAPCGLSGRTGPSYEDCVQYYTSIGSPIIRDDVLTDTYSTDFSGSQSFRPPRDTLWNVTIAGAAGGRGLCNIEHGFGLVQYFLNIPIITEFDHLILAGAKGLGPCDTAEPDPGHMLCFNPPDTQVKADACNETFTQWANKLRSDNNITIKFQLFSGGAGGGGASYMGYSESQSAAKIQFILGVSGGGGGTSSAFDYPIIRQLIPELINDTRSDEDIYLEFVDAKPTPIDTLLGSTIGGRGYRIDIEGVQAGAGGGFLEFLDVQISLEDGRAIGVADGFADGGRHCTRSDLAVPAQLREAVGGFGGGGGGCGEGGGGGGYTGGAVIEIFTVTPGGGGFSYNALTNSNEVFPGYTVNDGDGYVDIVAADCGCVYECVVYEEEDQFECLCPNDTQLAPDLSDCYNSEDRQLTVTDVTTDADSGIVLKGIAFGNSSFIFNVKVNISSAASRVRREAASSESDDICVLMFVGEDNNIVLATNPVMGSGRAVNLSRVSFDPTDDALILTGYTSFLDSSVLVIGAVLAGTGECEIGDVIAFNASTREIETEGVANFTELASDLFTPSSATNTLLRQILQLPTSENDRETSGLSNDIIAIIIVFSLIGGVICGVFVVVLLMGVYLPKKRKRKKMKLSSSEGALHGDTLVTSVGLTHVKAPYNEYQEELQTNDGYEVLDFEKGDDDGVSSPSETLPSGRRFTSKFGVKAPVYDFTEFNRTRSNTGVSDWDYLRSNLIFMRDLGEGQFGKVMLMKATNIAGYTGKIAVAVKTLSSRDPTVIQKFMEEVELMKRFSHPNIISLLGVCDMSIDDDSAPLMILEYMPYGDLHGFLETHRPSDDNPVSLVSENIFYNFAFDVAEALDFLSLHKYVHRDIAARNCLVGANLQIKIADFGLARGVYDKDYYRVAGRALLPVRWMAPECLLYGVFTTASDVWAYGVLLWEITSYGLTPLDDLEAQEVVDMAQQGTLQHSQPKDCPSAMYDVMCKCHKHEQEERPLFSEVLSILESSCDKTRTHSVKI